MVAYLIQQCLCSGFWNHQSTNLELLTTTRSCHSIQAPLVLRCVWIQAKGMSKHYCGWQRDGMVFAQVDRWTADVLNHFSQVPALRPKNQVDERVPSQLLRTRRTAQRRCPCPCTCLQTGSRSTTREDSRRLKLCGISTADVEVFGWPR